MKQTQGKHNGGHAKFGPSYSKYLPIQSVCSVLNVPPLGQNQKKFWAYLLLLVDFRLIQILAAEWNHPITAQWSVWGKFDTFRVKLCMTPIMLSYTYAGWKQHQQFSRLSGGHHTCSKLLDLLTQIDTSFKVPKKLFVILLHQGAAKLPALKIFVLTKSRFLLHRTLVLYVTKVWRLVDLQPLCA